MDDYTSEPVIDFVIHHALSLGLDACMTDMHIWRQAYMPG